MIKIDEDFLEDVAKDILESHDCDLDCAEKKEALEDLIENETDFILKKLDLKGVSQDQMRILKEAHRRSVEFPVQMASLVLRKKGYLENMDSSFIYSRFNTEKWFIEGTCHCIEDYKSLRKFLDSGEESFEDQWEGQKVSESHILNSNLKSAMDLMREIGNRKSREYKNIVEKHKINKSVAELELEIIELIETSTLKLSRYERHKNNLIKKHRLLHSYGEPSKV